MGDERKIEPARQIVMKIPVELYPDEFMRVIRNRLEMTQAQLAKRLGVARGTVTRYELAENRIPPEQLEAIRRMAEE